MAADLAEAPRTKLTVQLSGDANVSNFGTVDFHVCHLWDGKGSAAVEAMDPAALTASARLCGWTMARAYARSGAAAAMTSYLSSGDSFDRAIAAFAQSYAEQNEKGYATLKRAASSARVSAQVA